MLSECVLGKLVIVKLVLPYEVCKNNPVMQKRR